MLRRKRIIAFLAAAVIIFTAFFGNGNLSYASPQPEESVLCTETDAEAAAAVTEQGTEEPDTEADEETPTEEKETENAAGNVLPAENEMQPEETDAEAEIVEDLSELMENVTEQIQEIMVYATVDTDYTFTLAGGGSISAVCENEHVPVVAHTSGGNQIHCIDANLSSAFQWTNYGWQSGGLTWSYSEISNSGMADVLFEYYKGDNPNRSVSSGEMAGGTGSAYNQLTHDLDAAAGGARTAPTRTAFKIVNASGISVSGQTINAAIDTVNNVQKTETLTFLTGTTYLHHYVTVPSGVTMHYTPSDTGIPATATNTTVALVNGSTAYFTAPLAADINVSISSTCINRDFTTGYYIGTLYILAPQKQLVNTSGSYVSLQRFMYCDGLTASESFSVNFAAPASLQLQKASANPEVTDGNSCYSLENAVYGVYASRADAQADTANADGSMPANPKRLAAITTNASGYGRADNLAYPAGGVFYVKELAAPKGYALDLRVYTVNAVSGGTATLQNLLDPPQLDPAAILVEKKESRGVPLADAEFTVKYYDVQLDTDPALSGITAKRTWVFRTDEKGQVLMIGDYLVSGDDFYYSTAGNPSLPIGTVTIQETKAPEGYYIDNTVYVRQVTASGNLEQINTYNAPVVTDNFIPGKIVINKTAELKEWNEETREFDLSAAPMQNAVFGIYAAEDIYVNGSDTEIAYEKDSLVDTVTTNASGHAVSIDLYAGKYVVKENNTPAGYETADDVMVTISTSDSISTVEVDGRQTEGYIKTVNILNKLADIEIGTMAKDDATGTRQGSISETCSITDTTKIRGIVPGREYMLFGMPVDKEAGKQLVAAGVPVVSGKTFTADAEYEEIDVTYTFNSLELEGHDIVFYEYLYYDGELIALHEDIEDEDQTIHFPEIRTMAKDSVTGTRQGTVSEKCTLTDAVSYKNLIPGKEYTVNSVVMYKTGNPVVIDGVELTAEKTFTAETEADQIVMTVTFDSSNLAGKDVVFFEYLYHEGVLVTMHADLEDEAQTISFPPKTPPTGDGVPVTFLLLAALAALIGMILCYRKCSLQEK